MNWKLFIYLLDNLASYYWVFYSTSNAVAFFLHHARESSRVDENTYWMSVKIFRFFHPVRKLMWLLYVVINPIVEDDYLWLITAVGGFWLAFIYKDPFGDDPRDKKSSKVLSYIRSIGHRLVVVPQ